MKDKNKIWQTFKKTSVIIITCILGFVYHVNITEDIDTAVDVLLSFIPAVLGMFMMTAILMDD